jgi:hypothetical protein
MIELVQLGSEIQAFMETRGWRFCFIGGVALMRWGEPRFTQDVDLTLLTGFGNEQVYIDELLQAFAPRAPDMSAFALRNRVILLKSPSNIGIDVALGGLPFEERVVERSSLYEYADATFLRTCSAEDLITMKAFAEREQDWLDIAGVLTRQGEDLNWHTIWDELRPLAELKESPDIVPRLETLRSRHC